MIRLEKGKLAKVLLAIPLAMVHSAYVWIGETLPIPISELVISQIFGRIGLESSGTVILSVDNLCFSVLFNIVMAGQIAEAFRYSCVYVFTRIPDRTGWVIKRVLELLIYAAMFQALYMVTTALLCSTVSSVPLSGYDVEMLLVIFGYCLLILMNTTLAVNFLAMRFGTVSAFFMVQGMVIILFLLALATRENLFFIAVNPVSCVGLLNYQSGVRIGMFGTNLAVGVIVMLAGIRYIRRYDVALADPELN